MTREEAAREIDNTACCFSDKRFRDSMHMAAAALRGPQPDPITGLVPCGCGGKAVMKHRLAKQQEAIWYVRCDKCDVATAECFWELAAKNDWNGAMGWKESKL